MFYEENMTIDKKYLNVLDIPIFDTERELHGILSEVNLLRMANGLYIQYYAHYDNINKRDTVWINDFKEGHIKFVLLNDEIWKTGRLKEAQEMQISAIKEFLGENYTDDSIIWISEQERKDQMAEQEYREKKKIGDFTKWAESATHELIFENYSAMKMFCLYTDKVVTKEQFLIELVNILAEEKRVQRDMQLNGGLKNFTKDIEEVFDKNKDFFREIFKGEE